MSPEDLQEVLSEFEAVKFWGAVGEVHAETFQTIVKNKNLSKVGEVLVELRRR